MSETAKHSSELEQSLLAAVLTDSSILDRVNEITTGVQFVDGALGKAFDLIADRHHARLSLDITVLVPEFRKAGFLEALGGTAGLARLTKTVPTASHSIYHAKEINRLFRLRQLQAMVSDIESECGSIDADPDQLLARIDAKSRDLCGSADDGAATLATMMMDLADQ
ncbi:MAG: DnaB-like helicase N-terminal domain-containing protein, partial [Planctomycetota bacterium]